MKRPLKLFCILLLTIVGIHSAYAADDVTPLDIVFKRQAVGRLSFDEGSAIPLSGFKPNQVVNLKTEYPQIPITRESCRYTIDDSLLHVTSEKAAESALWMGGFNPFATFDVSFAESQKQSGKAGVEFATPDNQNRVSVVACFHSGQCCSLRWSVMVKGKQLEEKSTNLKKPVRGPFTLRVQLLGSGLNVFIVRDGRNEVASTHDFSQLIDLRQKKHIQSFEFRLLTQLNAGQEIVINQVNAALTTGVGQADICALTYEDGSPLLDNGRLWFTMSVRGRHLPHPLQGVFSLNPSVFDVRLESIIVFDRGDGLLRNEIASHIFYDRNAEQWRGLTVGFSAEGDPQKIEPKQLWAVSSKRDPRCGFTIMKAAKVDMPGASEDPHIVYDADVQKWRVLVCAKGGPGYPATLYEADQWNGPFKQIAGPVDINSTGCLLQKFGGQYYALFGGKGGQFHVYSYPELNALGALDMDRPPWSEGENSRCWPNVIPLPEGYPAPYIALSMDRANYPGLKGWTYGALYLYHGNVRQQTEIDQSGQESSKDSIQNKTLQRRVLAQYVSQPKNPAESVFIKADLNSDGRLGPDEVKNKILFKRMDANSNGFVSIKEAQSFAKQRRARENATTESSSTPVFPAAPDGEFRKQQLLSTIPALNTSENRPPNIVLLFADDLGYGDTSLYGSEKIPTPNIDSLGKQGVRFSNAYVTAASCSPSRAGLMSGQYQQRFGFEFNTAGGAITHRLHRGLDPSVVTMADVLKQAGYVTGMFGKWHLGTQPQFHPQARGFDEFYGFLAGAHSFFAARASEPFHSTIMRDTSPLIEPEYLTDAIARETVAFIEDNHEQPFFAYVPFNAVHTPIEATNKYQDRFPNESNQTKRDYYAMTSALDDAVGSIVAAIDKHGITDNTLVIFVNDNGGPTYTGVQSNGPLKLGKLFLFEGGIRVPMVFKFPGTFEPNTEYDEPTSTLDLFPTMCGVAGIELPAEIRLDGVDLTPFIKGKISGSPHDTLFWSNGPNSAVRHGDWKLIKSYDNTWLFNLASDIGESKNLAKSEPEIVEQLEALYHKWRSHMVEPAWPSKPNRRKVEVDGLQYELNI